MLTVPWRWVEQTVCEREAVAWTGRGGTRLARMSLARLYL